MSLKEYISQNKIDLEHKAPPPIWDEIDEKLFSAQRKTGLRSKVYLLLSSTAAIAIIGIIALQYFQIKNTNKEIYDLKNTMIALLQEQSVGQRIKAITLSEHVADNDSEIAEILLHTMANDPSKNVRLAAIDALNLFAEDEAVRVKILNQLSKSDDTYTQIKLINLLSSVKDKKAVPMLDKIIKDQTKNILVKEKAMAGRKLIIET